MAISFTPEELRSLSMATPSFSTSGTSAVRPSSFQTLGIAKAKPFLAPGMTVICNGALGSTMGEYVAVVTDVTHPYSLQLQLISSGSKVDVHWDNTQALIKIDSAIPTGHKYLPKMPIPEAQGLLRVGDRVRTNADGLMGTYSDVLEGMVQEVSREKFVINVESPSRIGPWFVSFSNTTPEAWIEIPATTALPVKKPSPGTTTKKKEKGVTFDSVIISPEKKQEVLSAIAQHEHFSTIFEKWGFAEVFEKGTAVALLFHGVPGTGKTLMAQAVANKLKQKMLTVGPAEIETSTPGGAERNIKRYFKIASGEMAPDTGEKDANDKPIMGKKEPHVLLFDECDSLITNRENVGIILRGQINTLLSELEHFEGTVIFTTNSINALDPAMERRLTSKIEFEFPNFEARMGIWKRMIPKKCPLDKKVDIKKLAEFPFAGGNIKNIVLNAARTAAYQKLDRITYTCFLEAMEKEAHGMKAFEGTSVAKYGRSYQELVAKRSESDLGVSIKSSADKEARAQVRPV